MSDAEFEYHGEVLPYFFHMYNLTHLNERMAELAIAHWWLATQLPTNNPDHGLEVGNVLGHYRRRKHTVVDLHEQAAWYQWNHQSVINEDMFVFVDRSITFPWVCSISTIEHTGAGLMALEALKMLTQPGGKGIVTFPTGVDEDLDRLVAACLPGFFDRACTISRCGDGWLQDDRPVVSEYGPWANTVAVCEWTAPE